MLSLKSLVELQVHRSLSEYITALVWSPVGNRLAIASGAGEVVLWQDFQETILQAANGASIDALGFSGEGAVVGGSRASRGGDTLAAVC
ncbi:hypothetical protein XM38_046850 [Halomicronema hongdechloris C2206]|uniref:Anaphase-promoting complex subunit 4 WD40 domain-containing protein n=1 Tax=Halomicronema hongdechloris C2206 TaxID=1641165 RepID=A0A1Z3HTU0_9CYAN|nr:WD40 repeat domain-containing protein [Halomicronema hongdechloris]ASC73713.1 hypothetical protein XM38_046850 [Halomicronema hongdechloris C2206]